MLRWLDLPHFSRRLRAVATGYTGDDPHMTDRLEAPALTTGARAEHVFPTLTADQMKRIGRHGKTRAVERGDVLIEAGDRGVPFFVVTRGAIEIVRPGAGATPDQLIVEHRPGEFPG